MELGIAEVNLVGLLGELGTTWSRWGQPLFPIGVLYDPFVERGLEPWSFGNKRTGLRHRTRMDSVALHQQAGTPRRRYVLAGAYTLLGPDLPERVAPMVTVLDGHPRTLASWPPSTGVL
jgi:hypothetical protein